MDVKERTNVASSDVSRSLFFKGVTNSLPEGDKMVGRAGLEPATPRLSSVCSNQLSYRPLI